MTAGPYEACWYWCDLTDGYELEEPDWARVPENRRERVRANWRLQNAKPQRVKLWGPQIRFYERQPKYGVTVIGAAT